MKLSNAFSQKRYPGGGNVPPPEFRAVMPVFLLLIVLAPGLAICDIQVHAAASLTDALQDIAMLYQNETKEKVQFNFGSSSMLARQIQEGAPGDIFFSADEEKMDVLQKKGLIFSETRKSVLSNTLAIIVLSKSKTKLDSIQDLAKLKGNIAIAEPQIVPAGIYTKAYLKKVGIWNRVIDRLIPTDNVRATLAIVESGNAEAGIVYKTDALISKRVRVALEISTKEGPPISYPIAVLKGMKNHEGAMRFYRYLIGNKAIEIYKKYGFLLAHGNDH